MQGERLARIGAVKSAMLGVAESGVIEAIRNAENEAEAREILRGRMIMWQEFSREG